MPEKTSSIMEFMEGIFVNKKKSYKNPVFLFTSCSLRFAAWAGWYSAFGDKEKTEQLVQQARTEWAKEIGATRRFDFFDRYNSDIWKYVPAETMKKMVDKFLKDIKTEIKKGKEKEKQAVQK